MLQIIFEVCFGKKAGIKPGPFYRKPKVSKLSAYTRNAIINAGLIQLPFMYIL